MSLYTLLAAYCMTGLVISEPAPDISTLRILSCSCTTCNVKQIGYGSVRATFNGAAVNCSEQPINGFDHSSSRVIIGWELSCDLPVSSPTGWFRVSYYGLGNKLCGKTFDEVYLSKCSFASVPCSMG